MATDTPQSHQLETALADMKDNAWQTTAARTAAQAYEEQREFWLDWLAVNSTNPLQDLGAFIRAYPRESAPVQAPETPAVDMVNHPPHYTSDPSGVECITITRHRNFNIGNAIKYLWRNGRKDDPSLAGRGKQLEDLRKAVFYINNEIERIEQLTQGELV